MTAIILLCFGTLNTESLSNHEFFNGTRCLLWHVRCEDDLKQYGYTWQDARAACMEAWR